MQKKTQRQKKFKQYNNHSLDYGKRRIVLVEADVVRLAPFGGFPSWNITHTGSDICDLKKYIELSWNEEERDHRGLVKLWRGEETGGGWKGDKERGKETRGIGVGIRRE